MKKTCVEGLGNYLKKLLKNGVEKGVFTGAAVGLYSWGPEREETLFIFHGKTRNDKSSANEISDSTLFDLASLTKPLCTVLSLLRLVENKKIALNTTLNAVFGTKTGHFYNKTKIIDLLSHSSGLKGYSPYYRDFSPVLEIENKEKLLDCIFKEEPVYRVGEKCEYSDLGYILLGEVVERVSGRSLNDYFSLEVAARFGLENQLMFRPVDSFSAHKNGNIAATQDCPWRKRILQGEVDDEHSWLMNGVAGHAGLFGTINGVLELTTRILNQWREREEAALCTRSLLRSVLTRQYPDRTWCLGFDTPSAKKSSGGSYISEKSVGHLGFTGTSFWIDPVMNIVTVLLTNRVHPSRDNEQIREFRPLLHDTIYKYLQKI